MPTTECPKNEAGDRPEEEEEEDLNDAVEKLPAVMSGKGRRKEQGRRKEGSVGTDLWEDLFDDKMWYKFPKIKP